MQLLLRLRHSFLVASSLLALIASTCITAPSQETSADVDAGGRKIVLTTAGLITGLPGFPKNCRGQLTITPTDIRFISGEGSSEIDRHMITKVSFGDERVELGGTGWKIARLLMPYGAGNALAAVTNKRVGILTIEFLDAAGQYRGAVFVLRSDDISAVKAEFTIHPPTRFTPARVVYQPCSEGGSQTNTVRLEPIEVESGSTIPSEDRVLLYEDLIQRLKSEKTISDVYRAGDSQPNARCAKFDVTLRVGNFTKGNQAIRATVGTLGYFVGNTTIRYHLTVSTQDGTLVIDKDMKKTEGSDHNSLDINMSISRNVVRKLKRPLA